MTDDDHFIRGWLVGAILSGALWAVLIIVLYRWLT